MPSIGARVCPATTHAQNVMHKRLAADARRSLTHSLRVCVPLILLSHSHATPSLARTLFPFPISLW